MRNDPLAEGFGKGLNPIGSRRSVGGCEQTRSRTASKCCPHARTGPPYGAVRGCDDDHTLADCQGRGDRPNGAASHTKPRSAMREFEVAAIPYSCCEPWMNCKAPRGCPATGAGPRTSLGLCVMAVRSKLDRMRSRYRFREVSQSGTRREAAMIGKLLANLSRRTGGGPDGGSVCTGRSGAAVRGSRDAGCQLCAWDEEIGLNTGIRADKGGSFALGENRKIATIPRDFRGQVRASRP